MSRSLTLFVRAAVFFGALGYLIATHQRPEVVVVAVGVWLLWRHMRMLGAERSEMPATDDRDLVATHQAARREREAARREREIHLRPKPEDGAVRSTHHHTDLGT
jgi:hypothetical protein